MDPLILHVQKQMAPIINHLRCLLSIKLNFKTNWIDFIAIQDGSASGGDTIETIDPLYQQSLGQRTGLTFYDAKSINIAYCKRKCPN